jgi:hypothetical protein
LRWRRIAPAASRPTSLFILIIVRIVYRTEEQLDDPEIGSEVDWRVSPAHLILLNFKVGGAVDEIADSRLFVQFAKELAGLEIVSNLSKLEGDGPLAITCAAHLTGCILDRINQSTSGFTGWLTIGDSNDHNGFSQLAGSSGGNDEGVNDFSPELGTCGR